MKTINSFIPIHFSANFLFVLKFSYFHLSFVGVGHSFEFLFYFTILERLSSQSGCLCFCLVMTNEHFGASHHMSTHLV